MMCGANAMGDQCYVVKSMWAGQANLQWHYPGGHYPDGRYPDGRDPDRRNQGSVSAFVTRLAAALCVCR